MLSLCQCLIPCISLSLGFPDAFQPVELLLQDSILLKKLIHLGTLAPTTPNSVFGPKGDFQIPEYPTAGGLGNSLGPQGLCLHIGICHGGSWPVHLGFGLSPAGAAGGQHLCFSISLILLTKGTEGLSPHTSTRPAHASCCSTAGLPALPATRVPWGLPLYVRGEWSLFPAPPRQALSQWRPAALRGLSGGNPSHIAIVCPGDDCLSEFDRLSYHISQLSISCCCDV